MSTWVPAAAEPEPTTSWLCLVSGCCWLDNKWAEVQTGTGLCVCVCGEGLGGQYVVYVYVRFDVC